MSGSSGSTTIQRSEPWEGLKPYVTEGYKESQELYNKGAAQYFPTSTVAGFGQQTENALNAITRQGMGGRQGRQDQQYALDRFGGGGLGDWGIVDQIRTLGGANNYASSPVSTNLAGLGAGGSGLGASAAGRISDITQAGAGSNSQIRKDTYDLITGAAQNANPAYAQLGATAGGNYIGANPYLDAAYNKAALGLTRQFAEGVAPGIDSGASRAGRYGSGMHANIRDAAGQSFGQQLGDLATNMYGGAYGQERQNQLAAAGSLGSLYQSGQGLRAQTAGQSAAQAAEDARLRLAASGQLTGAEGQDIANKLAANQQLGAAYEGGADRQLQALNASTAAYNASRAQQLQALGMQPAYQQMGYADLNAATGAGQARDQLSQQQLNDQIARHDFRQNADWQNLARYLATIQGGSPGQSITQTSSGGLGGLASLFAAAGGLGQLAGGTRGLLWGLPGTS